MKINLPSLCMFLAMLLAALLPAQAAIAEKRVALVIGNSDYKNSPLKNPRNDAKDMAAKLRSKGFDVVERDNLRIRQIGRTLSEFRSKLAPGAVAVVFYAGHGIQVKGENYLPAVDADIEAEDDVANQSLSVRQIMDVLEESKSRLNLVFLDACRNNPLARGFRSAERGLARVSAPSGTLISYATRPGSVAADGEGRNGLYTSRLLAHMDSNLLIEQALKRVVTEVKQSSQGRQEPWMEGSIEGDFCFGGCRPGAAQVASLPPDRSTHDQDAWNSAMKLDTAEAFQAYLSDHPQGRYAKFAHAAISKFNKPAAPARIESAVPQEAVVVFSGDVEGVASVKTHFGGDVVLNQFNLRSKIESEALETVRAQFRSVRVARSEDAAVNAVRIRISVSDLAIVNNAIGKGFDATCKIVISVTAGSSAARAERSFNLSVHGNDTVFLFARSHDSLWRDMAAQIPDLLAREILGKLKSVMDDGEVRGIAAVAGNSTISGR